MKSISHCQNLGNNIVAFGVDDKGARREIYVVDVRAGISFPTGTLPGYFVLIGRQREQTVSGKNVLLFMAEGEDLMHEAMFATLTDACAKYKCRTVYADLPTQNRRGGVGGYDDLWRYLRNKKLKIALLPAPASDDVEYGKALIREFWTDKAMDLPELYTRPTTLRKHLKIMTGGLAEPGKDNKTPNEEALYAFHAMRYLVCGFVKYNNMIPFDVGVETSPRANAKGWT